MSRTCGGITCDSVGWVSWVSTGKEELDEYGVTVIDGGRLTERCEGRFGSDAEGSDTGLVSTSAGLGLRCTGAV